MKGAESGAREASTLNGELRQRPLAVLLAGACERMTSGTFTFRSGSRSDSIVLRGGKIASVATSDPVAYLGGILYELGHIDMKALDETLLEVARNKRLHGQVLLERGFLTPRCLEEGLIEQSYRKIQHLFALPDETRWAFREDVEGEVPIEGRDADRPAIDTWPAIWRGLRNNPAPAHVRRTLEKVEGGISLRDMKWVSVCELTKEEAAICERLHAQPSTLQNLVKTSPLVAERTEMLVYLLALARAVVRIETQHVGPADLGIEGVRDRAARVADEDHFTVLGLRADATVEAARAAYFRLARLWHPDKVPAALAEVRPECARVFSRLGEAHKFITELGALRKVDETATRRSLVPANDSVAPPRAEPTMHDVDIAIARGDIAAARLIAHSLRTAGAQGPSARAALAWCDAGAGAVVAKGALEHALASLEKVLAGDPDCTRGLYYRGQIQKRLGRTELAFRDFKKVTRLDPRHLDAQREVRIYEMRVRSGSGEHPGAKPSRSSAKMDAIAAPATPVTSGATAATGAPAEAAPTAPTDTSMRSNLRRLLARVAGR